MPHLPRTSAPRGASRRSWYAPAPLLATVALLAACGGPTQEPPPEPAFSVVQPYSSEGRASIQDVAIGTGGDLFLAGYVSGPYLDVDQVGGRDAVAMRAAPDGDAVWTLPVASIAEDEAFGVAVAPDGRSAFALATPRPLGEAAIGDFEGRVVVADADGVVAWDAAIAAPQAVWAYAVAFTPTGGVAVVGETLGAIPGETHAGGSDAFVRVFDADGSVLWTDQFGTPETDVASGVAVDAEGRVLVGARTRGDLDATPANAGSMDGVARLYAADGTLLWSRSVATDGFDAVRRVVVASDGTYLAVGTVGGDLVQPLGGERDAFMRRWRLDGSVAGTWQFGTSQQDDANGVAATPDGDVVVAGRFGDQGYLRGYALDGTLRFAHTFGTIDGSLQVESLAVGADGTVVVAADGDGAFTTPGTGARQGYLLVFDAP